MKLLYAAAGSASDSELRGRVTSFLAERHLPGLRRLTVEAQQGTVTLRGRVQTFYEKQICVACKQVQGVKQLIDDVDVA